jgi:hypothetical protein
MHPESQWVSLNPHVRRPPSEGGLGAKAYEGFRIPQLMVPWLKWDEILVKYATYPKAPFYNEVLGLSFDSGTRPLTRQDIIDNCVPGFLMSQRDPAQDPLRSWVAPGCLLGRDRLGRWRPALVHGPHPRDVHQRPVHHLLHPPLRGQEMEPPIQMALIDEILKYWNVAGVGVDYGGGFDPNDTLTRKFGNEKIRKYQYSSRARR